MGHRLVMGGALSRGVSDIVLCQVGHCLVMDGFLFSNSLPTGGTVLCNGVGHGLVMCGPLFCDGWDRMGLETSGW